MEEQSPYIQALIKLHHGLTRLAPGDDDFSKRILKQLPPLPAHPRIADIGCGTGAGALMLAAKYRVRIKAVDFSAEFLLDLQKRAQQQGLENLIEIIQADMGKLNWPPASLDLLWSEGAAYNIGFACALRRWRPWLAVNAIAVLSEMSYFTTQPPEVVSQYMKSAYPGIRSESQNSDLIKASGFKLLGVFRLPSQAWWDNYYRPLSENIRKFKESNDSVMQDVIKESQEEMQFFKEHHQDYGYSFYILQAV